MQSLPIDPLLFELCTTLRTARNLVLQAPPGAGKTTRVPRAMMDAGFAGTGEILVLEPRRLAAKMAARRIAEELGEEVGGRVGYTMRFEEASSPGTRIRFVTEGVLTRRLLRDPALAGVSAVVLDEFHERHLHGDVALTLLCRMQKQTRPDLHLLVMSATLHALPIASYLSAPVMASEGRMFDVHIEHAPRADDRPLPSLVASALRRLLDEHLDGDVLVFLPGAMEIRRAMEACEALAARANLLLLPLHGTLTAAEQDRAVRPADRRKVIFSTNVAETSVTIEGIASVIDSGLARIAASSPWTGIPTLRVSPISQASAAQRAGRAGRTREGRCLRLYTQGDLASRPLHDTPEILRADLAETVLELFASGIRDPDALTWLDPPPKASFAAAETLLKRLGAVREDRTLTDTGRRMLRFPAHPRQARILVEAEQRDIAADGCTIAAIIGERELISPSSSLGMAHQSSDVLAAKDAYEQAEDDRFSAHRLRSLGMDWTRAQAVQRTKAQFRKLVDRHRNSGVENLSPDAREQEQLIAILSGFPDRVARVRRPANATGRAGREFVFATGGTAVLSEHSLLSDVELAVAVDVEERSEGRQSRTRVRSASAVSADALLELFIDSIRDTQEMLWNEKAQRVEVVRRLSYEGLVLEESRGNTGDPAQMSRCLAEAARAKGWRFFFEDGDIDAWLLRLRFIQACCPDAGIPVVNEEKLIELITELCEDRRSFAEILETHPAALLKSSLGADAQRKLNELAPEMVVLPSGRKARVDYSDPGAPSLSSRLQDFFGMVQGPSIARGRVPLVLHLLAPNHRAVQVTTDLAGFWERHYPALARELRRKYPRHSFPDDPKTAVPMAGPKPRHS